MPAAQLSTGRMISESVGNRNDMNICLNGCRIFYQPQAWLG